MTEGRAERIGIFGGTFDPPHIGHLVAALEVRGSWASTGCCSCLPTCPGRRSGPGRSPLPRSGSRWSRAAIEGLAGLEVSDLEIRRGGDSYTIDTVEELLTEDPAREIFVVVGADTEPLLGTWARIEDLRAKAKLVVVSRGDDRRGADVDDQVERIAIPRLEVSSTELRIALRAAA